MTGTSHLVFGIGTGVAMAIAPLGMPFYYIPIVAASSLLPDIDSATSKIGRKVKWVGKTFGHRGFFHTPLFLVLFWLIPDNGIRLAFISGIASHLFLDLLNKGGIPLFWPLSKKKFRLANLKCGAWIESGLVVLFMIIEMGMAFRFSPKVWQNVCFLFSFLS